MSNTHYSIEDLSLSDSTLSKKSSQFILTRATRDPFACQVKKVFAVLVLCPSISMYVLLCIACTRRSPHPRPRVQYLISGVFKALFCLILIPVSFGNSSFWACALIHSSSLSLSLSLLHSFIRPRPRLRQPLGLGRALKRRLPHGRLL